MSAARKFGAEFMARAVGMYRERLAEPGTSKAGARKRVGELLDVNPATLRNWVEAAERADGTRAVIERPADSEEVRSLRKRVAELERANEILKTASRPTQDLVVSFQPFHAGFQRLDLSQLLAGRPRTLSGIDLGLDHPAPHGFLSHTLTAGHGFRSSGQRRVLAHMIKHQPYAAFGTGPGALTPPQARGRPEARDVDQPHHAAAVGRGDHPADRAAHHRRRRLDRHLNAGRAALHPDHITWRPGRPTNTSQRSQ